MTTSAAHRTVRMFDVADLPLFAQKPSAPVCGCHRGSACDISHDPATCSCEQCVTATVGSTILDQIRAADRMAFAAWGVKMKFYGRFEGMPGLKLCCARGRNVMIQLADDDTYTVVVGRVINHGWTETSRTEGVYFDSLVAVIGGAL